MMVFVGHTKQFCCFLICTKNMNIILSGKMTQKKFWDMLSQKLIAQCYSISAIQCKSKMTNEKHKSIKDHNSQSRNNRRTWHYFDVMDEIFNKRPWVQPPLTLDSDTPIVTSEKEEVKEQSLPTNNPKLSSKRKKKHIMEQFLEMNVAEQKKMHEEAMARQDKLKS